MKKIEIKNTESNKHQNLLDNHAGDLEDGNYISHLFYCFLNKIVKKGAKGNVNFKDLWNLLPDMSHKHNSEKFIKYYYDWQER